VVAAKFVENHMTRDDCPMTEPDDRSHSGNYDYRYDPRTFKGRKRLAERAKEEKRDQSAIASALEEPNWSLWRAIFDAIYRMW
jgi:hypothetical protein